jgi:hypothetical protein
VYARNVPQEVLLLGLPLPNSKFVRLSPLNQLPDLRLIKNPVVRVPNNEANATGNQPSHQTAICFGYEALFFANPERPARPQRTNNTVAVTHAKTEPP